MRLAVVLIALTALFADPPASWAVQAQHSAKPCLLPAEFTTPNRPLDQVAAALASGGPVNILAVGSATTVGENDGGSGVSFPYRMVNSLRAARPKVTFNLTVRGGRGMTAEAMLPLITEAVAAQRYELVLWQTGTVEAVRGQQPDAMLTVLQDGADRVREARGDVVLIDQQFSRFLRANVDLDPYQNAMQAAAALPGVALFHRYDLMQAWVNDGQIDMERTDKANRPQAMVRLNACLGEALAQFVLNGAAVPPR